VKIPKATCTSPNYKNHISIEHHHPKYLGKKRMQRKGIPKEHPKP
jgi:hypothetical protein